MNSYHLWNPVALRHRMKFYPVGDLSWLFDRKLPHTGFSASHMTTLAARPQRLSCTVRINKHKTRIPFQNT